MAFSTGCQSNSNLLKPSPAYNYYLYSTYATYTLLALLAMDITTVSQDIIRLGLFNEILGSKSIDSSSV